MNSWFRTCGRGEGSGSRLSGQGPQPVEDLRHVVQAAVDDLQLADAVVGIAHTLRQFIALAAQRVGNRQARRVIGRAIDAIARGQPADRRLLESAVY